MNVSEIKKAGATIGADFENGMATVAAGLVAKLLPIVRELPKGKAVAMLSSFWEQFAANAPVYGGAQRVKVTRSESLRLAAGIDAGQDVQTGAWNELLKTAPKKISGKGAGGGRKKRAAQTPTLAPDAEKPETVKPATPTAMLRQMNAAMLAVAVPHKVGIALALYDSIQATAAILAGIPKDE